MIRSHKNAGLACLLVSVCLVPSLAIAEDSCKDILVYAAHNYMQRFTDEQQKAWVYSKKCSSKSSSAGLDMLVEAVPIGVSISDSKQSCDENQRLDAYKSIVQSIDSTVSVPALQNWSSCMEASSRNLVTKVRLPNNATIQLNLRNGTPYTENLTEVLVQSDEGSGINCPSFAQLDQPRVLEPARDVLVNCTRSYVDVRRKGVDYQVLPGGSITVVTSLSSYSYGFPEVFREQVTPPEVIPQRIALSLKGAHVGTHAYWGGGSQLLECSSIEPPGPNFELVVIGTREEPVVSLANRRGRCGVPPFCDSAGERCAEVYYTAACYINKEWHQWYKADALQRGTPYSMQSVCGP